MIVFPRIIDKTLPLAMSCAMLLAVASCKSSSTAGDTEADTPQGEVVPEVADVPDLPDLPPELAPDVPGELPAELPPDLPPDLLQDIPPDQPQPLCCKVDKECGALSVCVGKELPDGGVCHNGKLPAGECFYKNDCPDKHFCWGADICSCTMNCISEPGECKPLPGGCCKTDGDCDQGYTCALAVGAEMGVCELAAPAGKCWDDLDCKPWQSCDGEKVCPCNADCAEPDKMGTCFNIPGCCDTEVDCGEGDWVCVKMPGVEAGVCRPPVGPSMDACWTAADCAPKEKCVGVSICPCGMDCSKAEMPGKCIAEGCCDGPGQCKDGERCEVEILGCVPIPEKGKCWHDSDCEGKETCVGAYLCPCPGGGYACTTCKAACFGQDHMGMCVNLYGQGCCKKDSDCLVDNEKPIICAGPSSDYLPEWKLCIEAAPPGWCWRDQDCAKGEVCHGAAACPCFMDCDMDYSGPGICVPAEGKCAAVQESWVKEWCDAASLVIFDGEKCVATGPGCCECKPFCQYTFESMDECKAACPVPGPGLACTDHAKCPGDKVCLSDFEGPSHECGLCGKPDSCHCGTPAWPGAQKCSNDQDCADALPCGDQCDDCPYCPKCVHGWCVYETYEKVMCLCTGCA